MSKVSNIWFLLLVSFVALFTNNVQAKLNDSSHNLVANHINVDLSLDTQSDNKLTLNSTFSLFTKLATRETEVFDLKSRTSQSFTDAFYQKNDNKPFFQGFSLGGMAFLSFIFLFLYVVTSSKSSLLLSGYFISRTLFLSVLLNKGLHYYLPQLPEIEILELPLLTSASSICLLWFSVYLFKLKTRSLSLYNAVRIVSLVVLAYIPISLVFTVGTNLLIGLSIHSFALFVLIMIGNFLIKQKTRLAHLFTWVILIQFVISLTCLYVAINHETSDLDNNMFLYGLSFWIDGFLIIFLFSREYHYQIQRQHEVQEQLLTSTLASKKAQEELLTLQQETQEQLEIRVQEHTLELHVALQELEDANRELTEKNTLDELTGLYNRRFYDQKILAEHRRSRRNLTPLSLVIIDIDHFKSVNDNYGHLAGDHCLTLVAKQLKLSLHRTSDIGCRYGGEEFCIILPETDPQGAFTLAEILRNAIATLTVEYENQVIPLTISCGVSTYQQQTGILPDHIFAAADKALYLAKHQGRNQTQQVILQDESQSEE